MSTNALAGLLRLLVSLGLAPAGNLTRHASRSPFN